MRTQIPGIKGNDEHPMALFGTGHKVSCPNFTAARGGLSGT